MSGEVLFLALLQLAGAGAALAARLRPGLACALGLPLGLALWSFVAGLLASLGVPPHAAVTMAPAFGAVAALVHAGRPVLLALSALAVAGLAAAALALGIASVPPLGHDALLAAQLPIDAWGELDPAARFLAIVHGGVRALGAPFAIALGPLAGLATAILVAAGCWRRPAVAVLAALALVTAPIFLRAATAVDLPVFGAMFVVAFAVVRARGARQGSVRLLPIECLLLAGLAIVSPAFAWIAAALVPLAYRADPRPPARIAAWLGVLSAGIAWWYLAAVVTAPDFLELALAALAPLAGTALWFAIRRAAASPAAAPAPAQVAAWLFAGAMVVALLSNLAVHARQHRRGKPGVRLIDPGPTGSVDPWVDLHSWIKRKTPGVTAVIPARLAPHVVLFRYLDGVEVVLADSPPTIPATAALDLVFRADAFRTLQFKTTRVREWVVAIARPPASRYVLAESIVGVLYWLPEELYLESGGEPPAR